jgi:hypothetical protein
VGALARLGVDILVYATTIFAVIRAIPVLWDGRRYIAAVNAPKTEE